LASILFRLKPRPQAISAAAPQPEALGF
jgi:hypothetical protein